MKKYVGISLSACMRDICENSISIEKVAFIATSYPVTEEVIKTYCEIYWRKYPLFARQLVRKLQEEGRLVVTNLPNGHNICNGVWIKEKDYVDENSCDNHELKIHTADIETVELNEKLDELIEYYEFHEEMGNEGNHFQCLGIVQTLKIFGLYELFTERREQLKGNE